MSTRSVGFAQTRNDTLSQLLTRVSAQMAERGLNRPQFEARFDLLLRSIYTISGVAASVLGLALVYGGTPVAIAVKGGALVIATLATNYLTDQLAIWVTLMLV